jgi:uncharacterized membrane protein YhaH (DUF805 family)
MVWLLFSFEGRINRAKFYLAGLMLLCWMMFLLLLFVGVSAAFGRLMSFGFSAGFVSLGAKLDVPQSFHLGIDDIFALADPATWRTLPQIGIALALAHAIATPLLLWVFLAVCVKRLHDRDKSGWWMMLFFVAPGLYKQFEDRLPDSYFLLPAASAVFVFAIWGVIEMYFLRGTQRTNRFGPDPLAEDADARLRSRGLGSRGPAWDQRNEIELAPHRASPPPSMRVNRGI